MREMQKRRLKYRKEVVNLVDKWNVYNCMYEK